MAGRSSGRSSTAGWSRGTSLAEADPAVASEFLEPAPGFEGLDPTSVSFGSNAYFRWLCPSCNFEWTARVKHRTGSRSGCPNCRCPGWTQQRATELLRRHWPALADVPKSERGRILQDLGALSGGGLGRALTQAVADGAISDRSIAGYLFGGGSAVVERLLAEHDPRHFGFRRKIPDAVRQRVYERDGHRCLCCNTRSDLSLDHIEPHSLGGSDEESNLQALCLPCNLAKRDRRISLDKLRQELVERKRIERLARRRWRRQQAAAHRERGLARPSRSRGRRLLAAGQL